MIGKRTAAGLVGLLLAVGAGALLWGGKEERPGPKKSAATPPTDGPTFLHRACDLPESWVRYIYRGWLPGKHRDTDLIIVPDAYNYAGSGTYTSHAGPYAYLQEIPLIFYGPGHIRALGRVDLDGEVTLADLAPTTARILDFSFPNRTGAPVPTILEDGVDPPRLVVTISVDGMGWNVLDQWRGSWPNLESIIESGASVDAVVGSSPSITPPAHTNMSTGLFPRDHGVTGIGVRAANGDIVGGFAADPDTGGARKADPTINLKATTLGDLWDLDTQNAAQVALVASGNYPLGMLGHGSSIEGADKDIAAMSAAGGTWATNTEYFAIPSYVNDEVEGPEPYLRDTDLLDGELDGKWRGHDFPLEASPALAPWTNEVVKEILDREGFGDDSITDLLFLHHKAPDIAGHEWNMINPEQSDVIESVDSAIGDLRAWLDREIGPREYVIVITADHGQTPLGRGSPISMGEIRADVDRRFDHRDNDVSLVERSSPTSLFLNRKELTQNDVSPEEIATFLSGYTASDNGQQGGDELLLRAVFPGRELDRVRACAGAGQ
ncbi:MAG: alkaline phosphatase family protein [Actinomycetota bacterium]|nr:alkaline phosphatase family protein [Actinomycetota bacterium]